MSYSQRTIPIELLKQPDKHEYQYASSKCLQSSAVLLCRSSYKFPFFNNLLIQVLILAIAEEALIGENEGDCITIDGVCADYTIIGPQPWVNFTLFAVLPHINALTAIIGNLWIGHFNWTICCRAIRNGVRDCRWLMMILKVHPDNV